ncbi:MAG TPA: 16S rRNA (adenine(1518)-N(6)/adenine(1519)-N(6))-dimethyltransferase RsmA [bacterium]|nr:16S rRNA (adenine(1518)-N(6)/adenine(1519)-N(6))-dimethyltransferase RsmA [bacterium]
MAAPDQSLGAWTRQTLQRLDIKPSKKLGQNFLVAEGPVQGIIDLVDPKPDDQVVEIGGGVGVLSRRLAPKVSRYVVFEVDRVLNPHLDELLAEVPGAEVLGDALTEWTDASAHLDSSRPVKVVGNIPYQITGPLLERIFSDSLGAPWETVTLMVQREVAERMFAKPGDAERGRLSVAVEFHALPGPKFPVSREAFHPKPNVDSTVLQLRPRPVPLLDREQVPAFEALLERGFHMRRKTIWNNLRDPLTSEQAELLKAGLEANGVEVSKRPQDLELKTWLKIFWVERDLGLLPPATP